MSFKTSGGAGPRPFLILAALGLGAGCAAAWICYQVLGFLPHVPDEISYAFQGRIFASGRLYEPAPPVSQLFSFDHIILNGDRWFSIYPPGWPLLLAIGWLAHAPWIVNPLLLCLTVIATWLLSREMFDAQTGWIAVVLFVSSPFVLMMHSGFMAHPAALCSGAWAAFFLVRSTGSEDARAQNTCAYAAGACAGLCFLIRPATAVALLWPLLPWFWTRTGNSRLVFRAVAGAFPFAIAFFIYNSLQFGGALNTGYALDQGFKPAMQTPHQVWSHAVWYFRSLNAWLWEWPFPNLLILLPLLAAKTARSSIVVLALCAFSLVGMHCFFYWTDIVYAGPRYMFEAMAFLCILAARSITEAIHLLLPVQSTFRKMATTVFVSILSLAAIARVPEQMQFHSQMYHARSAGVLRAVLNSEIGADALVMIDGNPYIYGSFLLENQLRPADGSKVFVRYAPTLAEAAQRAYPRRHTWRVRIEMDPIPGPNQYPDRWRLKTLSFTQVQ